MGYVLSNVTARIRRLEEDLKTTLFHRHSRGVILTASGHRLLKYAHRILQLVEEIRDSQEPAGPLSLGATESTAAVRLPRLLSDYHRLYPEVEMSLVTASSQGLTEKVLDHSLDCALVAVSRGPTGAGNDAFVDGGAGLGSPPSPSGSGQDPHLSRLRPRLHLPGPSGELAAPYRMGPLPPVGIRNLDAILGCVQAGMGTGVLTRSAARHRIQDE